MPRQVAHQAVTEDDLEKMPVLLTVEQAAAILGISRQHAYDLIRSGEFPSRVVRVGRAHRVPKLPLLRAVGLAGEAA